MHYSCRMQIGPGLLSSDFQRLKVQMMRCNAYMLALSPGELLEILLACAELCNTPSTSRQSVTSKGQGQHRNEDTKTAPRLPRNLFQGLMELQKQRHTCKRHIMAVSSQRSSWFLHHLQKSCSLTSSWLPTRNAGAGAGRLCTVDVRTHRRRSL